MMVTIGTSLRVSLRVTTGQGVDGDDRDVVEGDDQGVDVDDRDVVEGEHDDEGQNAAEHDDEGHNAGEHDDEG